MLQLWLPAFREMSEICHCGACIQILGLVIEVRKIDVAIYFTCKYGLLQMCLHASGA